MTPSFSIETNCVLFQSPAIHTVGIPPIQPNNKFKFRYYDLDDDAQYGYESDNKFGPFIVTVSGEEDYDNDKDITDSRADKCRDVNKKIYGAGKLVF